MTQSEQTPSDSPFQQVFDLVQKEIDRLRASSPPLPEEGANYDEAGMQWLEELHILTDQLYQLLEGNESPENIINAIRSRQPNAGNG